jgi:plasmid stabilization system protein ParE
MRLILSRQARADLAEIKRYTAQDSPRAAAAILTRLDEAIQRLLTGELQGREVGLLDGRRVQGWPVPPYRIYYERTASYTRIVRVYHGARRPIER